MEKLNELYNKLIGIYHSTPNQVVKYIPDRKSLGVSSMYLSSIIELLHNTKELLDKGFFESAGSLGAALWERALTHRYIHLDLEKRVEVFLSHERLKKHPWTVWKMAVELADNTRPDLLGSSIAMERLLVYNQYSFFSAIKHGNPYTLVAMQNNEKNSIPWFKSLLRPNNNPSHADLSPYILMMSMDCATESLYCYAETFCKEAHRIEVKEILQELTRLVVEERINPPQIIIACKEEFTDEEWKGLREITERGFPSMPDSVSNTDSSAS